MICETCQKPVPHGTGYHINPATGQVTTKRAWCDTCFEEAMVRCRREWADWTRRPPPIPGAHVQRKPQSPGDVLWEEMEEMEE